MESKTRKNSKQIVSKKQRNKKEGGLSFPPPCWAEKAANMAPSWAPKSIKKRKKTMQKSIKNLMHLGIDFWEDFGGFWKAKWSQVGTKIDQKSMPIAKCDFLKNRALAAAGARFLRFWGSKLGVKID